MIDTAFLDELASKAPTRGGGGAAAYVGAVAAALANMVGNLTVGKKKYADVEPQVYEAMERLEQLRGRLVQLIDEDALAFEPLAASYGMPRSTPEEVAAREEAQQKALVNACEVPLSIMETCVKVLDECDFLAHNGSRLALSDVGCAVVLGRAAVHAASLNVIVNAGMMTDAHRAQAYRLRVDVLIEAADDAHDLLYPYVLQEIS